MSCGEQVKVQPDPGNGFAWRFVRLAVGVTKLLLLVIPYFREVIVMPFGCEHPGAPNDETQSVEYLRRMLTPSKDYCGDNTLFLDSGGVQCTPPVFTTMRTSANIPSHVLGVSSQHLVAPTDHRRKFPPGYCHRLFRHPISAKIPREGRMHEGSAYS